jgi:hypothetical protein
MKFVIIYIIVLFTILISNGCDTPAPTELVQDSNASQTPISVQVVAKDTGDTYYNNGFDTTGVADQSTQNGNIVINVSGVKVSRNGFTTSSAYAQAIFYDTSHQVRFPNGKMGYLTPGLNYLGNISVKFNNYSANLVPYNINFSMDGMNHDTTLGYQYILNGNVEEGNGSGLSFQYNSAVHFQFMDMNISSLHSKGREISFDIPTPKEIIGKIKLTGSLSNKTLNAEIDWNKASTNNISILIGAVTKEDNKKYPLYSIVSGDNGSLVVPSKLLNEIPKNKYNKLVFTLVRKIENNISAQNTKFFIRSQSIHSIILDIP